MSHWQTTNLSQEEEEEEGDGKSMMINSPDAIENVEVLVCERGRGVKRRRERGERGGGREEGEEERRERGKGNKQERTNITFRKW